MYSVFLMTSGELLVYFRSITVDLCPLRDVTWVIYIFRTIMFVEDKESLSNLVVCINFFISRPIYKFSASSNMQKYVGTLSI